MLFHFDSPTRRLRPIARGGATTKRARSNDLAERSTALALLCLLLCFGNRVNRKYKNVTISDRFIRVILTVKQSAASAACVLRATTKKGRKCTPEKILATLLNTGDLAGGFSDFEMTWLLYCAGAATAYSLNDRPISICCNVYNVHSL